VAKPLEDVIFSLKFILFITLVATLIRFAHGNVRLLDDSYLYDTENSLAGGFESKDRHNKIHWDFLFVLLITLSFSLMSFYLNQIQYFVWIFIIVLFFDVVWYLVTQKMDAPENVRRIQAIWFRNNVIFLILISLFLAAILSGTREDGTWSRAPAIYWALSAAVLLLMWANTATDLWFSRQHYFPSDPTAGKGAGSALPAGPDPT
jgi:uncharacterized membrane protein